MWRSLSARCLLAVLLRRRSSHVAQSVAVTFIARRRAARHEQLCCRLDWCVFMCLCACACVCVCACALCVYSEAFFVCSLFACCSVAYSFFSCCAERCCDIHRAPPCRTPQAIRLQAGLVCVHVCVCVVRVCVCVCVVCVCVSRVCVRVRCVRCVCV